MWSRLCTLGRHDGWLMDPMTTKRCDVLRGRVLANLRASLQFHSISLHLSCSGLGVTRLRWKNTHSIPIVDIAESNQAILARTLSETVHGGEGRTQVFWRAWWACARSCNPALISAVSESASAGAETPPCFTACQSMLVQFVFQCTEFRDGGSCTVGSWVGITIRKTAQSVLTILSDDFIPPSLFQRILSSLDNHCDKSEFIIFAINHYWNN